MTQPQLDKPGAGIPLGQKLYGRFILLPFKVRPLTWEACESQFSIAHNKVRNELASFPRERLSQQVLVPPQVGLEDSSRYWSAALTARHLTIVGSGIERIIAALTHRLPIDLIVDTAKVKPEEQRNDADALPEYFGFGDDFLHRLSQKIGDRSSKATHPHPWFGPMTAKDWMWLMGAHTFIHLKQLRGIRKGLGAV